MYPDFFPPAERQLQILKSITSFGLHDIIVAICTNQQPQYQEFIEKVVSERPRLFLISAMDRVHVQRTVRVVPFGRCGFIVLFMEALLSQ